MTPESVEELDLAVGVTVTARVKSTSVQVAGKATLRASRTLTDLRTEVHFMETADAIGPLGAKPMSESPFNPVAPGFTNALRDATGIHFTELPLTRDRVWLPAQSRRHQQRRYGETVSLHGEGQLRGPGRRRHLQQQCRRCDAGPFHSPRKLGNSRYGRRHRQRTRRYGDVAPLHIPPESPEPLHPAQQHSGLHRVTAANLFRVALSSVLDACLHRHRPGDGLRQWRNGKPVRHPARQ